MVGNQNERTDLWLKPQPPHFAHDHPARIGFIVFPNGGRTHNLGDRHGAITIIGMGGAQARQAPAGLGKGRSIGGMGVNHAADFGKLAVQHQVGRQIR